MKKIKWFVLSLVVSGGLSSHQAMGQNSLVPPGETLHSYGSQDPSLYQPVSYEVNHAGQPACDSFGLCDSCGDSCCVGDWRDNTEILFGGDAYASLGDSPQGGWNNSFGLVTGFNTGFALGDSNARGQFGATYGIYDFSGRPTFEPSAQEEQIYLTGGFSKRSDVCNGDYVSWGIVYDAFITDNWGTQALELDMGQVRGLVGYALNHCNEVGVWGTVNALNENETITGRAGTLRAMNQANLFWRHNYAFGGSTMLYTGVMDNADVGDWVFGLSGRSPLNDSLALYGSFNYVVPSAGAGGAGDAEDQWNIAFGLVYFFGGKSVSPNVSGAQGLPLMPVANNGSFLVTD